MAANNQIRLLVVEDVPQVAQYIRGLLNSQATIKLLDVMTDGSKVKGQIQQLKPDVVIIDALLQGRMRGLAVAAQLHEERRVTPVIILTVPQNPVEVDPSKGIDAVLSMPFSGYDLINRVNAVHLAFQASDEGSSCRMYSVFAPKGGVGKTTIAFNLAVAIGQLGKRTVLIDGSLQFGDLRALLKVPVDAPSILDLPTDRIQESDLQDVLWRDPSGIDILLAPPRVEMAEMVTVRDVDKVLSLLRRAYEVIVLDTPPVLNDVNLAFLDASDLIVEIVTYDSTTIHNTIAVADAFRTIGYPASKVRYLINRADSAGGIQADDLARALGRVPEYSVVSDGRLVVASNNEGEFERVVGVLLDDKHGEAVLPVQGTDRIEDLAGDQRCEAERGSSSRPLPGAAHQCAADREHLLLAARQRAATLGQPLPQPRKQREHALQAICSLRLRGVGRIRTHLQVFGDAHARENPAALRRLRNPQPRDLVGGNVSDVAAVEQDFSGAGARTAEDRHHQRRLAGPIRSNQGNNLARPTARSRRRRASISRSMPARLLP